MKEIFIVEDDDGIRDLTEYLLSNEGYRVSAFRNAESFEQTIQQHVPDLILLDIMLPDGNGREICSRLREQTDTAEVPIILMSAHTHPTETDTADDFIHKPFDIDDFIRRVGGAMKN